jgi:hypothetical protein
MLWGLVYSLPPLPATAGVRQDQALADAMLVVGTFAVLQASVLGTNSRTTTGGCCTTGPVGHFWFVGRCWVFVGLKQQTLSNGWAAGVMPVFFADVVPS